MPVLALRRSQGYEKTMSDDDMKKQRRRGRSADARKRRTEGVPGERSRRSHSAGAIRGQPRRILRVKSQFESLTRKGLSASMNDDSAGKRSVEFAFLEVREFPIILGDNPSCLEGPPVTIDWAYDPTTQFVLDINTFERMRGSRRDMNGLVLSKESRERKLMKGGVSRKDMAAAVREIRNLRHKRMVSQQQVSMDNMHESVEKVTHGLKKLFVFKKSEYEKTLEAHCEELIASTPTQNVKYALSA